MIVPVALSGLAVVLAMVGRPLIFSGGWTKQAPRLGVVAWGLTVGAMLTALVAAGVTATFPLLHHLGGFRELFHRCPVFFDALRSHGTYLLLAVGGLLTAAAVSGAAAIVSLRRVRDMRGLGRRHALMVRAVGVEKLGYSVVPGVAPAAWSIAVDGGHVVVTEAALTALDPAELDAVLAHERAHLRGRDHLARTLMTAVAAAVPCPLTRAAARETAELLEMAADDAAARRCGTAPVARALVVLSGAAPTGALGAGGSSIHSRLDRLLDPPSESQWRIVAAIATAVTGAVVPIGLALTAAWGVAILHVCPVAD